MLVNDNNGGLNHSGWHHGVYDGGDWQFLGGMLDHVSFKSSVGGSKWLKHDFTNTDRQQLTDNNWPAATSKARVGNILPHIQADSFVVWPMAFGSWHASISRACQSARRWLREHLRRGRTQVWHHAASICFPLMAPNISKHFTKVYHGSRMIPFLPLFCFVVNVCPALCTILQRTSHLLRVIC